MNKFTLIIHNKGWTVADACKHWDIHYDTYNARCNNTKMHNQLECMCNGLESRNKSELSKILEKVYNDYDGVIQ